MTAPLSQYLLGRFLLYPTSCSYLSSHIVIDHMSISQGIPRSLYRCVSTCPSVPRLFPFGAATALFFSPSPSPMIIRFPPTFEPLGLPMSFVGLPGAFFFRRCSPSPFVRRPRSRAFFMRGWALVSPGAAFFLLWPSVYTLRCREGFR